MSFALLLVKNLSGCCVCSFAADKASKPLLLSWQQRLSVTLGLYHYIGPLVVVYAAEYAMQVPTEHASDQRGGNGLHNEVLQSFDAGRSVLTFLVPSHQAGTWAAIGFPISDADARHRFYSYANW